MRQPDNLIETLTMRAEYAPEDIAFSYLDDQSNIVYQLSNQQLHTRAAAVAGRLQQIISPSDRVLLLFPQGLEFIYAFIGVMYSGAIPVITAPPRDIQCDEIRRPDIKNIIEKTNSNIVLTSASILNEVVQYFFKSKSLSENIILSVEEITDDLMNFWSMPSIENSNVAYLQRTSSKEGTAKLVMISHDNMHHTHERIKREYKLTTSSRSVNWLPHYHYLGMVFGILQPLYCGYKGYIYSQFDFYKNPHGWLNVITRYEITFSGAPNFAYSMCLEQAIDSQQNFDLSHWNIAYNSGEFIKKEIMDGFFERFSCYGLQETALTAIYGLSESTCVASTKNYLNDFTIIPRKLMQEVSVDLIENNQDSNGNVKIINCGSSSIDTQIAIVIPGTRTRCRDLELGEVLVSSTCNAIGYWNQSEETERIFNIYLDHSDDGPYLRTGNLGFIKEKDIHVISGLKDYQQPTRFPVDISLDEFENEKNAN